MLTPLLLALLPLLEDPPARKAPDPARVETAVADLKAAFGRSDAGPRIRAIESAAELADAEVVRLIGRGLSDKDVQVQRAAIEALRFNRHERALADLQQRARAKAAKEDLTLYAALLRAVGQHGSPSSIGLFQDDVWSTPDAGVFEARVLGLARIRTKDAAKAIVDLMETAGPNKIDPLMPSFRLALWSLTGADQRGSRDLWLTWWRENKDKLRIPSAIPSEPRELARRWDRYWARPGTEAKDGEPEPGQRRRRDGVSG